MSPVHLPLFPLLRLSDCIAIEQPEIIKVNINSAMDEWLSFTLLSHYMIEQGPCPVPSTINVDSAM